jgi:hypothetical protein
MQGNRRDCFVYRKHEHDHARPASPTCSFLKPITESTNGHIFCTIYHFLSLSHTALQKSARTVTHGPIYREIQATISARKERTRIQTTKSHDLKSWHLRRSGERLDFCIATRSNCLAGDCLCRNHVKGHQLAYGQAPAQLASLLPTATSSCRSHCQLDGWTDPAHVGHGHTTVSHPPGHFSSRLVTIPWRLGSQASSSR